MSDTEYTPQYTYSNNKLTKNSQKLRKEMTKEEKHLWYDFLSGLPVGFRRQKTIDNYIVDFYSYKAQLVIELDGNQHFNNEEQVQKDKQRDERLADLGLTVLRFSNYDINRNFKRVCEEIYNYLNFRGLI